MRKYLAVCGLALAGLTLGWGVPAQEEGRARPSAPAKGAVRAPLEPVPYRFTLDELSVSARGRTVMRDTFEQDGEFHPTEVGGTSGAAPPYLIRLGYVDGSYVRDGSLNINQTCSINPFENFAFDFSLPIDGRGRHSFLGKELFGDLVVTAKLIRPRIQGPEKFKIGLVEDQIFFNAAMVSLERDVVSLQRQGGEPRSITPFLETTFDEADLSELAEMEEVELQVRVDAQGRASGFAKIRTPSGLEVFHLSAEEPWARLNPQKRYSVHVFVEDLPEPRIFSIYPETVDAAQLQASEGQVHVKVFGIGIGPDSELELVGRERGREVRAPIETTKVLMFNMGLETRLVFPDFEPESYTVRVHTSGMTATVGDGFRVLE